MKTIAQYWEQQKRTGNKYHPGAFDFISIHKNADGFRLLSPLCIIEKESQERPAWEYDIFPSLKIAEKAAVFISLLEGKEIGKKIAIAYCKQ